MAPGFPASKAGRSILRSYSVLMTNILVFAPLQLFLYPKAAMALAVLMPPLGGGLAFLYYRRKVSRYSLIPEAVREAGLSEGGQEMPRWILWAWPPFLFPVAAAAWLHAHWSGIPARFPYHWNAYGEADRWGVRSERAVYGPLLFCAATLLLMLYITLVTFYDSRRAEQRLATMKIVVAAMYLLAIVFIMAR